MNAWGWFSKDPVIELLPDGRSVRIARRFWYRRPTDDVIVVPEGFVCDGASIPRVLWPLAGGPFEGRHRDAAIVHDYLYSLGRAGTSSLSRAEADRTFYEAMRCSGLGAVAARSKWIAVRLFGGAAWGR